MHPILILVLSIAVVVLLIIRFRLHAFLSLIIAAMTVGLLSDKVPITDVMSEATRVFGEVCGSIGVVIALAAVIGHCLMESGAADRITRRLVAVLGEKRSSLSMLTSGYVVSVPVFFDTVFYLLIPLARALRVRTGKNYLLYTMAICAGGAVTHTLVPPTPGPLAIATTLNIDLGIVILVGVVIGIPMSVVGWMFSRFMDRRLDIDLRTTPGLQREELEALAHRDESELPPFWLSILPIVLPIVLIASNTVAKTMGASASVTEVMSFVGDPNFALLLSAVLAMVMLARSMSYSVAKLGKVLEPVLASAGLIILITAAGGAYGGMLRAAGVGSTLAEMAQEWGVEDLDAAVGDPRGDGFRVCVARQRAVSDDLIVHLTHAPRGSRSSARRSPSSSRSRASLQPRHPEPPSTGSAVAGSRAGRRSSSAYRWVALRRRPSPR